MLLGIMIGMSHNISYSTADKADVLAFLGSGGNLTEDQQRRLGNMRRLAQAHQDSLDYQDVDWGLSVPDALDHLIAGRADSDAACAGNAYHAAMQLVIDRNASDPSQLGTYSKPSTFFGLVDDEMRRLGVPADLLPHGYLYGGLPDEFPTSRGRSTATRPSATSRWRRPSPRPTPTAPSWTGWTRTSATTSRSSSRSWSSSTRSGSAPPGTSTGTPRTRCSSPSPEGPRGRIGPIRARTRVARTRCM
ncbi:hypothetical protein ACFQ0M_17760 [Kitasatospora aburaviensis]